MSYYEPAYARPSTASNRQINEMYDYVAALAIEIVVDWIADGSAYTEQRLRDSLENSADDIDRRFETRFDWDEYLNAVDRAASAIYRPGELCGLHEDCRACEAMARECFQRWAVTR